MYETNMTELSSHATQPSVELQHFAANVAHDFNNLLTGILGNLELMQLRAHRSQITAFDGYIDGARNAGLRAAGFAQRLIALSGRTDQDKTALDVPTLFELAIAGLPIAGPAILRGHEPDATLVCDAAFAELALRELLINAAEAAPPGSEIRLSAHLSCGQLHVEVQDHGPGMPPDILDRATEPFFTTRTNGAGRGLGLTLALRFADSLGGRLHLASTPNQGTTAALILPVDSM